jgi:hypothetical protein
MINMFKKLVLIGGVLMMTFSGLTAHAQETPADRDGFINDDTKGVLQNIQEATGLPIMGFETAPGRFDQPGLNRVASLAFSALSVVKYIILGITILYMTISLVKIIGKTDVDEDLDALKKYVGYLVVAIVIVLTADIVFLQVLDLSGGGFLANEEAAKAAASIGAAEVLGIVRVIEALVGSIALVFLIIAGVKLVGNAGNEDVLESAKNQIKYSIAGIILVLISESLVREVFFVRDGSQFDVNAANRLIVTFTNFISGFIAIAALLSLLYAGFMYIFQPSNEDNAGRIKNAIIGAVVGIIIAAGAFAVVNTVIELEDNAGTGVELSPLQDEFLDTNF